MTEADIVAAELFGQGSWPRPLWSVLDAARERGFTGELVLEVADQVRVYLDRGNVYLAERAGDPNLGTRLVAAGAIDAEQLASGTVRLSDGVEHLGHLFERVPGVDRYTVLATTELLTEDLLGGLAVQPVHIVEATPYRRHPSGMHRWDHLDDTQAIRSDLPAPSPSARPVATHPPVAADSISSIAVAEDVISWDEPGWLDTAPPAPSSGTVPPAPPADETPSTAEALSIDGDWIDRLARDGLPAPGSDPFVPRRPPSAAPVDPFDRFEVIWPSGEIDDDFGSTEVASIDRHPDLDRAGPTARIPHDAPPVPSLDVVAPIPPPPVPPSEPEPAGPAPDSSPPRRAVAEPTTPPLPTADVAGVADEVTDDVVLAVRRTVAELEQSTLESRQPAPPPSEEPPIADAGPLPPGRVAVRSDQRPEDRSRHLAPTRSVFDEPLAPPVAPASAPPPEPPTAPEAAADEVGAESTSRTSALRRLINSLRR